MTAEQEETTHDYSVEQVAEARGGVVDLLLERDRYREALTRIEAGMPAGSKESSLAKDGDWRGFARDLQRMARMAMKDMPDLDVAKWNATHPVVGTDVIYRRDDGSVVRTRTRSEASVLSGHTAVIWLEGVSGCVALRRVSTAD